MVLRRLSTRVKIGLLAAVVAVGVAVGVGVWLVSDDMARDSNTPQKAVLAVCHVDSLDHIDYSGSGLPPDVTLVGWIRKGQRRHEVAWVKRTQSGKYIVEDCKVSVHLAG